MTTVSLTTSRCAESGRIIAENEITSFNRGAGGFGKRPLVQRKPAAVARNTPPEWVLPACLQVAT